MKKKYKVKIYISGPDISMTYTTEIDISGLETLLGNMIEDIKKKPSIEEEDKFRKDIYKILNEFKMWMTQNTKLSKNTIDKYVSILKKFLKNEPMCIDYANRITSVLRYYHKFLSSKEGTQTCLTTYHQVQ